MARVAVVTGGIRGIGRAIAIALKNAGYKVAANYGHDDATGRQFSEETGIPVYKFDVADFNACVEGLKAIEAQLGPVEVLINNAGITRDATLHRMSFEQWNAVIQTNLASCFNMSRAVIEGMRDRSFGRIVNIGSINGQAGQYGQVNYADYAMTEPFREGLAELRGHAEDHVCAIMCAEAVWWRCHRRIVADYLLAEGADVRHIMGHGKIEPARLTPGALPQADGTIRYSGEPVGSLL